MAAPNLFNPGYKPPASGGKGGALALPKLPPASSSRGNGKPADVPAPLWEAILKAAKTNGVTPQVLAGIWRAESGSTYPNPYVNSSGYGGLFGTTAWNASTQSQADLAASTLRDLIRQKGNLHDALLAYSGGAYATVPGVTVPRTAAQQAADAAREAAAKAASPGYIQSTTNLSVIKSQAVAEAKAVAHISDPWVTLLRGKGGRITGFGQSTGASPPGDVLMIGGQPATQSLFNSIWGATYEGTFEAYTGRTPTAQEQADILSRGLSVYSLRDELSKQPGFQSSPVFKQAGAGIERQATDALGKPPPPDFVRKAIAQNWDAATTDAQIRALPGYQNGPQFRNDYAQNAQTYEGIYGTADKQAQAWLHHATLNGWTPAAVGQALRSDPAYKYSPEYQAKAVTFLDAIGQITGTAPVAAHASTPEAVAQQTRNSNVGGVAPVPLQVSTVGG